MAPTSSKSKRRNQIHNPICRGHFIKESTNRCGFINSSMRQRSGRELLRTSQIRTGNGNEIGVTSLYFTVALHPITQEQMPPDLGGRTRMSDPHKYFFYCGFGNAPVLPHWPEPVPWARANGGCWSKQRNEYTLAGSASAFQLLLRMAKLSFPFIDQYVQFTG